MLLTCASFKGEIRLRHEIARLQDYRRNGITTIKGGEIYEAEKIQRVCISHYINYVVRSYLLYASPARQFPLLKQHILCSLHQQTNAQAPISRHSMASSSDRLSARYAAKVGPVVSE